MALPTADSLVQGTEFFQPPLVVSLNRKTKEQTEPLLLGLCLSPVILPQPEEPRAEVTCAGPVNTGLAGSKAAFLLPARSGVYGSQRPGMRENMVEGLFGFLSLEWPGWKQD